MLFSFHRVDISTSSAKAIVDKTADALARSKAMAPYHIISHSIWQHTVTIRRSTTCVSFTKVLDKAGKMNFIKSQLLGIHLLILCDEIGHIHKAFLLHIDVWWLSWGKALVQLFELQAKLATFLKLENCFTWKAKYHFSYSDLSIWQIFYQKSTKGACHCKGNNWESICCQW